MMNLGWVIDFNAMSAYVELLYALRLGNHIKCMFIFFVLLFPKSFFIWPNLMQIIF